MDLEMRVFGEVFDGRAVKLDYVPVEDVDGKYIEGKNENTVFVNILNPLFAIGGITHPDSNAENFTGLTLPRRIFIRTRINFSQAAPPARRSGLIRTRTTSQSKSGSAAQSPE
jgi:hypothetical protein